MTQRNKRILFASIAAFIVGFIAIQFWPEARVIPNPPVESTPTWDSEYTHALVERACFDCHSHETEWPWYTKIVPVSTMIKRDVGTGRDVLNFSRWEATCCTEEQVDAMAETVGTQTMPLSYYLVIHPEADLTSVERGHLINGLIRTMRDAQPVEERNLNE